MNFNQQTHFTKSILRRYARSRILQKSRQYTIWLQENEIRKKRRCSASWIRRMRWVYIEWILFCEKSKIFHDLNWSWQYLRFIIKAFVVLIHDKLNKFRIQIIIWLFQENQNTIERYCDEISSRYIVKITKLIDVEFIMIKTRRMIQLNSEWLIRDELQARKRINKITQIRQIHIYSFVFVSVKIEELIYDRQNRRTLLLNLTLNSNNIEIENIKWKINDDDQNDDDIEDVKSRDHWFI
jgi:hypothetical protein